MRPSKQFLIHQTVHPSNPYLSNLERRMFGRGFTPLVPNMLSIDSGGFSSSCALAFLTPSLHKRAASLYSSQDTCPCFHCLYSSLLLFSLTSRSRLSHAGLFPSLPDFLYLGTESSCALWKVSLKICQLCSAPLSLRTLSQGFLLTNSLNSWEFAFLKFGVLTILLACPISLRTVNSTNPRLPPVLMSLISSLALVTSRSSVASPLVGLSITWLKKLSSMHSRSLPDCLQLAVLLFQQMSGWLKSPSRTRSCEREASCSWRKKASSGQLFTIYPFLDVEGNTSAPPSLPVPSEQPVAIDSCTPVMGFIPPGFSNGNQLEYSGLQTLYIPGSKTLEVDLESLQSPDQLMDGNQGVSVGAILPPVHHHAETQARREEARLSSYSRSHLANPSIVGASVSVQSIIAKVLEYDIEQHSKAQTIKKRFMECIDYSFLTQAIEEFIES
ncbi:hypothetical protein QYF61_001073 [Mycteria americana]|uniref:Uncharacterized protein n=1 Tax=Mycteria americana TaxID=33587 RepID=A0AAN7RK68_MYCAM|nr:hypothetical protein QYF61_001070 [Mycteria americana]KAK4806150.1 hypothetical protein QYF61_001073 [Mycteria americana]